MDENIVTYNHDESVFVLLCIVNACIYTVTFKTKLHDRKQNHSILWTRAFFFILLGTSNADVSANFYSNHIHFVVDW